MRMNLCFKGQRKRNNFTILYDLNKYTIYFIMQDEDKPRKIVKGTSPQEEKIIAIFTEIFLEHGALKFQSLGWRRHMQTFCRCDILLNFQILNHIIDVCGYIICIYKSQSSVILNAYWLPCFTVA